MTKAFSVILFLLVLKNCGNFVSSKLCAKLLPGLNRLRSGVDISSLDMMPLEGTTPHAGFRKPLLDFTCNRGRKMHVHGKAYDLPDQVWNVARIPSSWLSNRVEIFENGDQIRRSMYRNVQVSSSFFFGSFTRSTSYRTLKETVKRRTQKIAQITASVATWRVDFLPFWGVNFTDHVESYIKNFLPDNLGTEENIDSYILFVKYFGTHYFKSGKFGGIIKMDFKTKSDYFKYFTVRQFAHDAQKSFLFTTVGTTLRGSGGYRYRNFTHFTSTTTRFYGGDTSLLARRKDIPAWQETVKKRPWLFSGSLAPIYSVIKDKKKRDYMKTVVKVYLGKMYLRELIKDTQWYADEGLQTAKLYHMRLRALLNQKLPSYKKIYRLISEIRYSLTPPLWFTKKTKLCEKWDYPWYRSRRERYNNCNRREFRERCASPNSLTHRIYHSFYQTHGCERMWKLSSNEHDEWFSNVSVCFRSIDSTYSKCGPQRSRVDACQPINKYTPSFVTNIHFACMLQWKIQIPDNAALWATKLNFCVQRSAVSGKRRYCGGINIPDKLCAQANSWTNFFQTGSHKDLGGCFLQWGIYYLK